MTAKEALAILEADWEDYRRRWPDDPARDWYFLKEYAVARALVELTDAIKASS